MPSDKKNRSVCNGRANLLDLRFRAFSQCFLRTLTKKARSKEFGGGGGGPELAVKSARHGNPASRFRLQVAKALGNFCPATTSGSESSTNLE